MFVSIKCAIWQYFVIFIFCIIILGYSLLLISNSYNNESSSTQRSNLQAHDEHRKVKLFLSPKILKLNNILDDDEFLRNDRYKKIFFVETHMEELRTIEKPRQACSVESAGI